MRVLVCGGRGYSNHARVTQVLNWLRADHTISEVIAGGANGADALACEWARRASISVRTFPANWSALGPAAGPIRNGKMLTDAKPDLVLAFPGGRGTADMVRQARRAGVSVIEVPDAPPATREGE